MFKNPNSFAYLKIIVKNLNLHEIFVKRIYFKIILQTLLFKEVCF